MKMGNKTKKNKTTRKQQMLDNPAQLSNSSAVNILPATAQPYVFLVCYFCLACAVQPSLVTQASLPQAPANQLQKYPCCSRSVCIQLIALAPTENNTPATFK